MIIQRWQNLLLFVSLILMSLTFISPVALIADDLSPESMTTVGISEAPVMMILSGVILAILVIAIATFKDLRRQMTLTSVAIVLIIADIITLAVTVIMAMSDVSIAWQPFALMGVSLVCCFVAYRFERKDRELLRSYDRLR